MITYTGVKQLSMSMTYPFSRGVYPDLADWSLQADQFNASYVSFCSFMCLSAPLVTVRCAAGHDDAEFDRECERSEQARLRVFHGYTSRGRSKHDPANARISTWSSVSEHFFIPPVHVQHVDSEAPPGDHAAGSNRRPVSHPVRMKYQAVHQLRARLFSPCVVSGVTCAGHSPVYALRKLR